MTARARLTEYLAEHSAPCPGCYRNLRGQTGERCPVCAKKLFFGELVSLHTAYGDAKAAPLPEPGSPEATRLDAYLARYDPPCPGCGYQLRGLHTETCPECGRPLELGDFFGIAEAPPARGPEWANTIVLLSFVPLAFYALVSLPVVIGARRGMDLAYGVAVLVLCVALGVVFAFPARRLMRRNLAWAVLFNPVTAFLAVPTVIAVLLSAMRAFGL